MRPRHAYIHVPFCARRCSYCDFSIAVRRTVPVDDYLAGLAGELAARFSPPGADAAVAEPEWVLDTLYLGGGTPSRLGGDGVTRLMELVRRHATLAPGAEVTLEANPDDVTPDATRAWVEAGVNRISLGVQSFDPAVLDWMHRSHTVDRIEPAVEAIRAAGVTDYSIDLIFALPGTLIRDWERDLERALALDPAHVSLYGLTVEPQTPLGRWHARGQIAEASEDRYAQEFLAAHEAMAGAGFDHYEVSSFGRPGRWSRHNQAYWRGVPYAGLGPGAHEFDGSSRRWNERGYVDWQRRSSAGQDPISGEETLTAENRTAEAVYLGLRTIAGLRLDPGELVLVEPWVDAGWGRVVAGGRLVLTPEGWLRMDALAESLTLSRSR